MKRSITQHSGGRQQLAVTDLFPGVLQGVGALAGFAPQRDVFAFLCGAFRVATGLAWLHCEVEGNERGEKEQTLPGGLISPQQHTRPVNNPHSFSPLQF